MNFAEESQFAQEISARIFLYVTEAGMGFDEAVKRAEAVTCCPPAAFAAGCSAAKKVIAHHNSQQPTAA